MEYRLNKFISSSGVCSRREADRFIAQGNVTVNGKRATIGMRVLPGQKVKVNGIPIEREIEPVYIAFNKPIGIVCTTDTSERDNIVDYVGHEQRVFPIGRLDKDSQGLILLTNDGDVVNKILRAENNHSKEYIVTVDKPVTDEFLTKMAGGVPVLDRVTRRCELVKITPFIFQITLKQGLNRQIRRMCEYFDYNVVKLERTRVMNVKLGKLPQGEWRDLNETEMGELFDALEKSDSRSETRLVKPKSTKPKTEKPKASNSKSVGARSKTGQHKSTNAHSSSAKKGGAGNARGGAVSKPRVTKKSGRTK